MSENDVKIKVTLDGADTAAQGLKGVGDGAEGADGKLGRLVSGGLKGVAIAGAAVAAVAVGAGAGLWNLAKGAADAGDRIDEMSNKLGISYEAYQQWDYILSQTGASIDSIKGGMQRLAVGVDEARTGVGPAAEAFARLGITMDQLEGKSREDIFALTISRLQDVTDGTERAAIAQDLLGRGASELGGLLNTTAADTEALKQQAIDLGLILSDEAVEAGDKFNDSLDTLQRTMQGVKNTIGAQLLPGLTEASLGLSGLLAGTEGSEERIKSGAETLVGSISEVAPRILQVFSSVLGVVATVAPQIFGSLVEGIAANLPSFISTFTGAVVSLVGIVATQAPGLVASGAEAVVSIATGISAALPTLIPVLVSGVIGVVGSLIQALPTLLQAGITLVQGLASGVIAAIPELIAQLPTLIEGIVAFIESGVPLLLDAGIELFTSLLEALPVVIDLLVGVLPGLITTVITALLGAIPLIIEAGITLFTSLVGALPTIITSIVGALPLIITAVLAAVLGALPMLVEAGLDLFVALIGALPQIIVAIVGAIPQIITGVIGALVDAIPLLIMAGVKLLVALVQNMPAIVGGIVSAVPQIISGLVGAIVGAVPQLASAGLRLIQGLWQGISDATGWLLGKIGGFVDNVMGAIGDFFGIASPSKRMRFEIGRNLPPGIGLGVDDSAEQAIEPIRDLNTRIMAEAQKLNTSATFTGTNTFTQSLVPMQATPTPLGPINVQAAIDPFALSEAMAESLAGLDQGEGQAALPISKESIAALADAIVTGLRADTRQGSVFLG